MTARLPAGPVHLRARWVLGHADGHHQLLPDGEVVFDRGRIVFVGRDFPGEVAERHDLGNAILTPGLIDLDALSDLDTTILAYDNHPAWKTGRVWPQTYMERGPYEMYSEDELVFQKRYAFQALLRNGITTALPIASLYYRAWGETFAEFAGAADAAEDLGLRVYRAGLSHRQSLCDASGRDRAVLRRAARTGRPRGRRPLLSNVRGPGRRADPHHAGAGPRSRPAPRPCCAGRPRRPRARRAGPAALLPGRLRAGNGAAAARALADRVAGRPRLSDGPHAPAAWHARHPVAS